jgi:hypothetical protein
MPHLIEKASSGRATCRACGRKIAAGEIRFGERRPNPYGDDGTETTQWFHLACGALFRPEPFLEALPASGEPIDRRDWLEAEARRGLVHRRLSRGHAAERAASGRASCRHCRTPIAKDTWRIALVYYEDGRFAPSGFVHAACAPAYFETAELLDRIRQLSPSLTEADVAEIGAELASAPPAATS